LKCFEVIYDVHVKTPKKFLEKIQADGLLLRK
jgi:hypothetical protein